MTVHRVYVATDARARRQLAADAWTAVRVLALLGALLVAAPLELVAAWLGLPPVSWTAARIAERARQTWRARQAGAGGPRQKQDQGDEDEVPELSGVVIPKEADNG